MRGPGGAAEIAASWSSSTDIEHLLQAGGVHGRVAVQQRAGPDELAEPRADVAAAVVRELERVGEQLARDRVGALDAALEQQLAPIGQALVEQGVLVGGRVAV